MRPRRMKQLELPTLERVLAVRDQSQAIGEFLEWLREQGISLCEWRESRQLVCYRCGAQTPRGKGLFEKGHTDPEDPAIECKVCLGDGYNSEHSGLYPASGTTDSSTTAA